VLKYEDVLKLEGLGWIEYQLPIRVNVNYAQPSIEINGSINMVYFYFTCNFLFKRKLILVTHHYLFIYSK
jgi:hypothetical protein